MRVLLPVLLLANAASAGATMSVDDAFVQVQAFFAGVRSEKEPLWKGLPKRVSGAIMENDGYDDFDRDPDDDRVIGAKVLVDGRAAVPTEERELFVDDHGILLPPGAAIRRVAPGKKGESWDFPIGTRFVHRFFLATAPRRLYELRLSEKRTDGRWAYGVYAPDASGALVLLAVADALDADVTIAGRARRVSLRGLDPQSCRDCHFMESGNDYPSEEAAGPCGFGPANKALRSRWAPAFAIKHGYSPFLD